MCLTPCRSIISWKIWPPERPTKVWSRGALGAGPGPDMGGVGCCCIGTGIPTPGAALGRLGKKTKLWGGKKSNKKLIHRCWCSFWNGGTTDISCVFSYSQLCVDHWGSSCRYHSWFASADGRFWCDRNANPWCMQRHDFFFEDCFVKEINLD